MPPTCSWPKAAASTASSCAPRAASGARPQYVTVLDDQAQATFVVDRVLEARERGIDLRRQAVLFRAADHSDVLELELMRRNVPFVKYGGLKFLESAHVKDLLAVLRWAGNPRNRIAAFRVLQLLPGMGPAQRAAHLRCVRSRRLSNGTLSPRTWFPPARANSGRRCWRC